MVADAGTMVVGAGVSAGRAGSGFAYDVLCRKSRIGQTSIREYTRLVVVTAKCETAKLNRQFFIRRVSSTKADAGK